jgi:hypothetical protein
VPAVVRVQIPATKTQKEFGEGNSPSGGGGTLVHWPTGSVAGPVG